MVKKWIRLNEQDMKAQLEACKALYGRSPGVDRKNEFKGRHGSQIKENDHLKKDFEGGSEKTGRPNAT